MTALGLLDSAVAARAALRDVWPTFSARYSKLCEVVAAVRAQVTEHPHCMLPGILCFDPPVPQSTLVHTYIGLPEAKLNKILDEVEVGTHIRVFRRVRAIPAFKQGTLPPAAAGVERWAGGDIAANVCYVEWNMGVLNAEIPTEKFVEGFRALLATIVFNFSRDPADMFDKRA